LLTGCFTTDDLSADGDIDVMFDLPTDGSCKLLPGVLHGYRVSADDLGNVIRSGQPNKDREDEKNDDDEGLED